MKHRVSLGFIKIHEDQSGVVVDSLVEGCFRDLGFMAEKKSCSEIKEASTKATGRSKGKEKSNPRNTKKPAWHR